MPITTIKIPISSLNTSFIEQVRPVQAKIKRIFDILACIFALIILSPLFLIISTLIKATSKGPIFFSQVRVGLNGRKFKMLKFRSMVTNAEMLKSALEKFNEQSGPVFKIKNDPRITSIGRFIRKYSIDELPQLFNIINGDMSIVGPRPPLPTEVAKYKAWHAKRLTVLPGLTCKWQVSGRNNIQFDEWMRLDCQYIDEWSFWLDIKLILQTNPVVLFG